MHDPEVVFKELKLKEGDFFLDLGCGPGDYAMEASRIVGNSGFVYALDKWQYLIHRLREKAASYGLNNIQAVVSDITAPLPVMDNCVDVCFMATVLHIPAVTKRMGAVFTQVRRVLKPDGRFAIIECKKEDMPFGPPKHMRLSPTDIENSIKKYGFKKLSLVDLGYNYMIQFSIQTPLAAPNHVFEKAKDSDNLIE
jgi:ubiquinone/menaquinone biosynthesis C-methylase UbiE